MIRTLSPVEADTSLSALGANLQWPTSAGVDPSTGLMFDGTVDAPDVAAPILDGVPPAGSAVFDQADPHPFGAWDTAIHVNDMLLNDHRAQVFHRQPFIAWREPLPMKTPGEADPRNEIARVPTNTWAYETAFAYQPVDGITMGNRGPLLAEPLAYDTLTVWRPFGGASVLPDVVTTFDPPRVGPEQTTPGSWEATVLPREW